ncbi:trypsin-1-like, partial [Tigriopus californicus]|uniref:trypsin-1-like n=1 Tax=Tigriopus californicus TaxID=6832 RepID=UPI0027DAA027
IGGSEVVPNSIPYQVSLQLSNFGNAHYCGASLIDENTLLTAAHCCDGVYPEDLLVSLGDHNLFVDEGTEQKMGVSDIKIHPEYDHLTISNDICLLILSVPAELNEFIQAVELPEPGQTYAPGTMGTISGWGYQTDEGPASDVLFSVSVPILSDEACGDIYGAENVLESMICAGGNGQNSCQGDAGGPMTCEDQRQCGIVSWGYGCALGYPGVNTEVSYFIDWINANKK